MNTSSKFSPANFLIPQGVDMKKWSVIACDQYTSQPEYWDELKSFVGDSPSALNIILPEVHLSANEDPLKLRKVVSVINFTMQSYIDEGLFKEYSGFVLIERKLSSGVVRRGLLGLIDLEDYDYSERSTTPIRATEGTVTDRLPPRVEIRRDAPLEMPHIMVLYDDPTDSIMKAIYTSSRNFEEIYNTDLYHLGGHITGKLLDPNAEKIAMEGFCALSLSTELLFAMGDGNHSLATAKNCYEELKRTLTHEEALKHPARYALVEAVNLHDPSLIFEPIHRAVFGVDPLHLLAELKKYNESGVPIKSGHSVKYITSTSEGVAEFFKAGFSLPVAALQDFLDGYLAENPGKIDYIHGDDTLTELASKSDTTIGFLLPPIQKNGFFDAIIADGSFPRKTFSMGNAEDKRFYLESRKIMP